MDINRYLLAFDAHNPEPLAKSPRGTLWRVNTVNGPAVLKVLSERGVKAGELKGAQALKTWNGSGAVRLLGLHDKAMLLEFLPGPCLGDTQQTCGSKEVAEVIAELTTKLRLPMSAHIDAAGYLSLQDNFDAALTYVDLSNVQRAYREIFKRAQRLWHSLIESTKEHCLMHGDLNLDNVLQSSRGWLAIDPKGLIGDPCYEFAITFRTPFNKPEVTASKERIADLAGIYAAHTSLDELRILQFGFAHVAMSLSWHLSRGSQNAADLALLQVFDSMNLVQ